MKGTKALIAMLEKKGVETMFGYPGGTVIPIFDELYESGLRHVLVRHEQCAAHMADGFARASGKPGVCLATSGPGATNLITGVATAYADSVPMIALTGQVGVGSMGLGAFQEVDAYSVLMPITKHNFRVLNIDRLPHAISEAWDICQIGRPGPVHIDLPIDQMNSEIDESTLDEKYGIKPVDEDISKIAEAIAAIKAAKRPLILVGGGAINAWQDVRKLAEILRCPVDTTLMGIGIVSSSYDLCMGTLGMHGRMAALTAMKECDLIISLGARFSDRTYGPNSRMNGGRVIHVDIDPTEFGKHGHKDCIDIQADCGKAVRMMIDGLAGYVPNTEWTSRGQSLKKKCVSCNRNIQSIPIAPQKIMREIDALIDDNSIITTDVGQNQMWAMHHLNINNPRQFLSSGTFGTMGFGLPAAIGAKAAKSDADVICITGDGGFQMVMQEVATSIAEDLPVTIVILRNSTLGMVRQWQHLMWNDRYSNTTLHANPDFVKLAEAFGAEGILVEKPGEISDALKEAKDCGRTCIVEIATDPDENVLPMVPAAPNNPVIMGRCQF